LVEEGGPVESIELDKIKPKSGTGIDTEESTRENPSYGVYKLHDIIAGPLELVPIKHGYYMKLYPNLVKLYNMISKMDRQQFI
jgi:hypothetical protein